MSAEDGDNCGYVRDPDDDTRWLIEHRGCRFYPTGTMTDAQTLEVVR